MNTPPDKVIQSSALQTPPNTILFLLHFFCTCFFLYSVQFTSTLVICFYVRWDLYSFLPLYLNALLYFITLFFQFVCCVYCCLVRHRSKISHKVDRPRGSSLWQIYHQIRCVVIWHPTDWTHYKRQSAIPRYIQCSVCACDGVFQVVQNAVHFCHVL